MLFAIGDAAPTRITKIPHEAFYNTVRNRLSNEQFQAMWDELDHRVCGQEVNTSSWIPGADWTDTPFQPTYEVGCNENAEAAAQFFGILLWCVMLERPEAWGFGRYEKDGIPIEGMTYFRLRGLD